MGETIGKVALDYTWYPGEDFYCDGAIEDELLEIVKQNPGNKYNHIIGKEKRWEILYHLSDIRSNIVQLLPVQKNQKVLEIGAGCGAISGALAQMSGSLTCVELSKKRSYINAYRNQAFDNMKILVGNFQDIEPNLTETYDYITLIGVLEYAQLYIQSEHPFDDFLKKISKHLAPGGKIVVAIENKLGMKYWAGCREDHLGAYFSGIEGYSHTKGVQTFSKPELERLFDRVGFQNREFYYPYPDYKFPRTIYSDGYLPKVGELNDNFNNFDNERMYLFDESRAFDTVIKDGLFPIFSNSYLILLTKEGQAHE